MTTLADLFPLRALDEAIENRHVVRRVHPDYPLAILSDHDGPHRFASDRVEITSEAPDMRKLGFQLARTAHWMVNDRGYTKRMAASDLRDIARQLLPSEEFAQAIGDAGTPRTEDKR